MTRTVLSLKDVEKHFGIHRAVAGVSLDIHENEFFALLGASGSGKTTLLRMIAGFESPSAGQILLDGQDITGLQPNRRPLNLMFQSYALFPHMTVAKNIAYGLEMARLPRGEIAARVDEILSKVQLSHLAQRKPDQLSGGQRQRVALARALVKRPKVLLLDEPLGALDKKLRTEMQLELKRIQNEFGITFIVVTHDQEEAMVMADRIAILHNGALMQCAPPREVYEYPVSRFAAEFIGVMNFLEVRKVGGALIASDGSRIRAGEAEGGAAEGAALIAAVRPERLRIGAGDGDNSVNGRIVAMAYHGQDLQLHVEVDIAARPMVVRVTAGDADRKRFGQGDGVVLSWSARDTRVYPA